MSGRPKVVVLGMMTKIPVAGVIWQTVHYLVGLERLGYEAYYVEAHARTPSMLMERANDDSSAQASRFLSRTLGRFGLGDRWAFQALHADGRTYGLSEARLAELYRSAALIINLHGGTEPRPEHWATDRLVYLGTDPVDVEVQLSQGRQQTVDYLKPHCAHFTFGENYGQPDCGLPVSPQFALRPTRQPVVLDFWQRFGDSAAGPFTTIGNWRQRWRDLQLKGETYGWSKHEEFLKFIDLPKLVGPRFELALSAFEASDKTMLEKHGWQVREALPLSGDIDTYRDYITTSFGEFTVAKDQNVRLRTGWFSDRAATYLAAGRPVITQDTGFGNILPTGEGLFAFTTIEEIVEAVAAIDGDYRRHSAAAADIAREYFDATRVLGRLIEEVGLPRLPPSLVIAPMSRRPTTLQPESVLTIIEAPLPVHVPNPAEPQHPQVSAVVVTHNGHAFARLCLETLLSSVGLSGLEVIVVDNASTDGTLDYLGRLAESDTRLRVLRNETNAGFPAAVNRGLTEARGDVLVVLNHDVVLPPRSLARLVRHLGDEHVGLVGPISNDAATEGEVDVSYRTLSELVRDAEVRSAALAGHHIDVPMLTMFCIAFRRQLLERVGLLDERFEIGLFEDDDYSLRVTNAGRRVACAEDVFVHHFGEAAFGALVPSGEAAAIFNTNRKRFEEKWGVLWQAHNRRPSEDYQRLVERIRTAVEGALPPDARVLVVSKGDEELLQLDGRQATHFPQVEGIYAGHYPGDSVGAIEELEALRGQGAAFIVFPGTSLWWLDHYQEFRQHLDTRYHRVCSSDDCVIFDLAAAPTP